MRYLLLTLLLISNASYSQQIIYEGYSITIPDDIELLITHNIIGGRNRNNQKGKMFHFSIESLDDPSFYKLQQFSMPTYRKLFYEIFGTHPTKNRKILDARKPYGKRGIKEYNDFVYFIDYDFLGDEDVTVIRVSTPIDDEILTFTFTKLADSKFIDRVLHSIKTK